MNEGERGEKEERREEREERGESERRSRSYNTRHDAVLEVIKSSITPLLPDANCPIADLHSHQPYIIPLPPTSPTPISARPSTLEHQQPHGMSSGTHHLFRDEVRRNTRLKENKYADLVGNSRKAGIYSPKLSLWK